jgi:hypothetical protein
MNSRHGRSKNKNETYDGFGAKDGRPVTRQQKFMLHDDAIALDQTLRTHGIHVIGTSGTTVGKIVGYVCNITIEVL